MTSMPAGGYATAIREWEDLTNILLDLAQRFLDAGEQNRASRVFSVNDLLTLIVTAPDPTQPIEGTRLTPQAALERIALFGAWDTFLETPIPVNYTDAEGNPVTMTPLTILSRRT